MIRRPTFQRRSLGLFIRCLGWGITIEHDYDYVTAEGEGGSGEETPVGRLTLASSSISLGGFRIPQSISANRFGYRKSWQQMLHMSRLCLQKHRPMSSVTMVSARSMVTRPQVCSSLFTAVHSPPYPPLPLL